MTDSRSDAKERWTYDAADGCFYSDDFEHDATLQLFGDFADEDDKTKYASRLLSLLSPPPPTTKPSGEAVAWLCRTREGTAVTLYEDQTYGEVTPLYVSPQPPTKEPK